MSRTAARPPGLGRVPFRGSEAVNAGLLTSAQLRNSAWRRLFRDVYVSSSVAATYDVRVAAAKLIIPSTAVIAGRSAARVWGVRQGYDSLPVEVRSPVLFGPVDGLVVHVGPVASGLWRNHRGIRVTTALETAFDIARWHPQIEAVAWIDALARQRALARREFLTHAALHHRVRGCRIATRTLALCDPRAESPPESELRLHLHSAGVMVVPQFWVMIEGQVVARVDLALPDLRLAIEYDGQWHADPHQLGRDRARLRAINRAGWQVYHVTKEDLRNPDKLVRDIIAVAESIRRSRA